MSEYLFGKRSSEKSLVSVVVVMVGIILVTASQWALGLVFISFAIILTVQANIARRRGN